METLLTSQHSVPPVLADYLSPNLTVSVTASRTDCQDFTEFYADTSMSGRGGGLYGLSEPLLQYQPSHASMEPPFKRKYEDW